MGIGIGFRIGMGMVSMVDTYGLYGCMDGCMHARTEPNILHYVYYAMRCQHMCVYLHANLLCTPSGGMRAQMIYLLMIINICYGLIYNAAAFNLISPLTEQMVWSTADIMSKMLRAMFVQTLEAAECVFGVFGDFFRLCLACSVC